jgi:hypothetical protein
MVAHLKKAADPIDRVGRHEALNDVAETGVSQVALPPSRKKLLQ